MNLTTPPPKKLSDLITLAIAYARKLDHDRYTPEWSVWHRARALDDKCQICLAGAVIAGTLGCPAGTSINIFPNIGSETDTITITDTEWRKALWALNAAREGYWLKAFESLHGNCADINLVNRLNDLERAAHHEFSDWCQFKRHLDSLEQRASELRELGL